MRRSRLEAFSDGVLAIVITIMVLELHRPEGPHFEDLAETANGFLSYAISFVYVGIYWNKHHHLFQLVRRVDGLVLLSSGAGGHTGWANPFAFVRAVRQMFDGPIVLSGGLSDGVALRAATVLGCDLGCVGTRFIATQESLASDPYKEMLLHSSMDDVLATRAFTGLPANFLKPSIVRVGLNPDDLDETVSVQAAREKFGGGSESAVIQRWADLWSAGHSVSGVNALPPVAELVQSMQAEFNAAAG